MKRFQEKILPAFIILAILGALLGVFVSLQKISLLFNPDSTVQQIETIAGQLNTLLLWLLVALVIIVVSVCIFILGKNKGVNRKCPEADNTHEINELKKAEEALRHSELRFRSLIEKGTEIIGMHDKNGKVIYISPSVEALLGYKPEDRIGKLAYEHTHPEDIPMVKEKLTRLMSNPGGVESAQWRQKHANGSWRWMEGVATNLLHDPSVNAVLHNFRDITEQKNVENELRISNERFEYATRATFDAIWDADLETGTTYWGNGFEVIFGQKLNNMYPGNDAWSDLLHLEDKERVLENIHRVINSKENNWSDEYRFLKANGEYAFVRDKGVVVRNEQGKATRMIGAMQDITVAKQAEEELRHKNEEMKQLSVYLKNVREEERKYIAREVHDELGQLASALKIDIDWLNIKNIATEEIGRKRLNHATKTIEVLIASIRKIASSLRPSVLDDFGLNVAIEWQCREFQNLNSIQCIFEPNFDDENLPMEIRTELFRMTQEALTNVMRHANASHVTVQLTEDQDRIYLRITDDGKGFDTKVKRNTLGLIGLRERAVSINGKLSIESQTGKGTTVLAVIPKR